MSQQVFGVGFLTITPAGGSPIQVGTLQDVSVSKKGTMKGLYGSQKVAVGMAEGEVKWTGKAKSAVFAGALIAALIAGATSATGQKCGILQETATLTVDSSTFSSSTEKAVVAQAATFSSDLGVYDLTAGAYLTQATYIGSGTPPVSGTYQVNVANGMYWFNTNTTGHTLLISYDYSIAATGHTISIVNQVMGPVISTTLKLYNTYAPTTGAKNIGIIFGNVVFPDIDIALKNTDWIGKDLTFEALDVSPVGSGTVATFFGGE